MKPLTFLAWAAAVLALAACSSDPSDSPSTRSCNDAGTLRADGESWACDCNTCFCEDGEISSTLIGCDSAGAAGMGGAPGGGSGGGGSPSGGAAGAGGGAPCVVAGVTHADGTSWSCDCNTCFCEDGIVGSTLIACVSPCQSELECAEGEYCQLPGASCSGDGWCAVRPDVCTEEYDPVCGCDGQTYGNACSAAAAGASVASAGACGILPDPVGCGGRLGDTCTESEYCAYQPGQYCGAADASSVCRPRPTVCTREYAPVCGCDGQTYSNACEANAAGTGINTEGPC